MTGPIYAVYGASGCGRGVMPLARRQLEVMGLSRDRLVFVDDAPAAPEVNGHRVFPLQDFMDLPVDERFAVIAIADGRVRESLSDHCNELGIKPWSIQSRECVLMDDVIIGDGAILSPFVTITSNIRIGRHFQANLYSYVEHDCRIGDFVTFAPGAKCNGNVVIEDHAYIGAGAILRQGVPGKPLIIGRGAVVGMGAVVTRNVAPHATVAGNPARPLKKDM